ncbi:MAG TPA: hypothetical protein VGN32_19935 [Ktedonobacterales bacterium]|nr:hypothetical protein [Ktedonobacterales bacterium]
MRPYGGGPTQPIRAYSPIYRVRGRDGLPAYHAGLNYRTGLGTYPTANAIAAMLERMPSQYVEIHIYGTPAWRPRIGNRDGGSPDQPDEAGNVWKTTIVPTLDALRSLITLPGAAVTRASGRSAQSENLILREWVAEVSGLLFEQVLAVAVYALPRWGR